jgi:hypothetical protein
MSTKNKVAIFSVIAVLALAVISGTTNIVVIRLVSAQNSTEQRSSEAGSNGKATTTTSSGKITNSTAAGTKVSIVEEASEMGDQAYDPNPVKVKA